MRAIGLSAAGLLLVSCGGAQTDNGNITSATTPSPSPVAKSTGPSRLKPLGNGQGISSWVFVDASGKKPSRAARAVDAGTASIISDDVKRVWVVDVREAGDSDRPTYTLSLQEMNCRERTSKPLQFITRLSDGSENTTDSKGSPSTVVPGTVGESTWAVACLPGRSIGVPIGEGEDPVSVMLRKWGTRWKPAS